MKGGRGIINGILRIAMRQVMKSSEVPVEREPIQNRIFIPLNGGRWLAFGVTVKFNAVTFLR